MGLLDFFQGASNAAAGNVSGPVDAIAWALRKAGIPVQKPVGGSEWMQEQGLTAPARGASGLLGEAAGLILPIGVAAKAPQIARGLLSLDDAAMETARKGIERAMIANGGIQPATVWHGSPHKFDAFDASKIGSGEGAQAYGHGLYFSDLKTVADEYAGKLSQKVVDFANKVPTTAAERRLSTQLERLAKSSQYDAGADVVGKAYGRYADPLRDTLYGNAFLGIKPMTPRKLGESLAMKRAAERLGAPSVGDFGNLYKVDLPDEHIAKMLDWDKPLSQQAPVVKDALGEADKFATVGDYIRSRMSDSHSRELFADDMRKAGVPGIKYLDGGSRGAGSGTSNYVVFPGNENILKILERNGQPLSNLGL